MDIIHQISNNSSKLKNRTLTYDGDSILEPDSIIEMLLSGADISNICTTKLTPDIKQYNRSSISKIGIKENLKPFDLSWNIPEKYKNINVLEYVINKYVNNALKFEKDRYNRLVNEIRIYEKNGLEDFLRSLIYINDVFEENNIVHGVGRGSSVASYVLYIIGIHMIDAFEYDLDFNEFIK